MNSTN